MLRFVKINSQDSKWAPALIYFSIRFQAYTFDTLHVLKGPSSMGFYNLM